MNGRVRVELRKAGCGDCVPRLTDIVRAEEKLRREVGDLNEIRIVDGDRLHPSQAGIFG